MHRSAGCTLKVLSLSAALALLLGACVAPEALQAESDSPRGEPSAMPPSSAAEPSETPEVSCGPEMTTGELAKLAAKLPAPKISTGAVMGWKWDPDSADAATYDPCAALSWITFPIEGATGSSPYIIALFHGSTYQGAATRTGFGFYPEVERVADARLQVTFSYAKNSESNADASGRALSTYIWDENTKSVKHHGGFPPGYAP
ncbi:LppP/LprE family lipoprotein [Glutamicibacter arilaitensis]|uniref:LppP/LprE family lipoprotein n=1 Tax=Glutamicibacter arilaitensis TaxID=256701 RepID=UPI003850CBF6